MALNGMGPSATAHAELKNIPATISGAARSLMHAPVFIEYSLFIHISFIECGAIGFARPEVMLEPVGQE
jgi:hypothetical protein